MEPPINKARWKTRVKMARENHCINRTDTIRTRFSRGTLQASGIVQGAGSSTHGVACIICTLLLAAGGS